MDSIIVSVEEMRASLKKALVAAKTLLVLDIQIQAQIVQIEQSLWGLNFDAFRSGDYAYSCRRGKWRFIRASDRVPVLDLPRNERCSFLRTLVIPGIEPRGFGEDE